MQEGREIELSDIPIARLNLFARSELTELATDSLLYRLFYESEDVLAEKGETKPEHPADMFIQTCEEVWKNKKLVLTKRRRGRFISLQYIGRVDGKLP